MFQKMEILDQLSLLFEKDPASKGLYGKQQTQSVDIDCKHRQSGLLWILQQLPEMYYIKTCY